MTEKDIVQIRSNVTNNIINIQSTLLQRNYNVPDYENDGEHLEDLDEIIFQLETLINHHPEIVKRVLGGEIKSESFQARVGKGVPLYLHLEVIMGIIEKGLESTTEYEPLKKELMMHLSTLREKAVELPFDQSFDPTKHISDLAIDAIVQSRGDFYYDEIIVNNKRYLSVETNHKQELYDISNVQNLVFEEDRKEVSEKEHQDKISIIMEAQRAVSKYYMNGRLPESMKEFRMSLISEDVNPSQLTYVFALTDELLKEQIDTKELEILLNYLKETEPELKRKHPIIRASIIEVDVEPKKKGMFERYRGIISKKPVQDTTEEDIKEFERARKEQIAEDDEVRDVIIFQRRIINEEEVLVPMSTDEYKVVKR